MNLSLETGPDADEVLACYPVAMFKANKRIGHSVEDGRIEEAIRDAFVYFDGREGWLRRAVLTQTWTMRLPAFAASIEIPLPPLQSVVSVRYRDADGALQTLHDVGSSLPVVSTVFHEVRGDLFGRLVLASGESWPTTATGNPEAVEIRFTCGFGDADDVPRPIKRSIGLLATHLYENASQTYAEPRLVEVPREIKWGIQSLAGRYRIMNDHA